MEAQSNWLHNKDFSSLPRGRDEGTGTGAYAA